MSTKNTIIELPAQFLSQLMRESFYYLDKDFPLAALKWEWNTLTFAATDSYKVLRFSTATPGEAPIGQGMVFTVSFVALKEDCKILEKAKGTCALTVLDSALFFTHDERSVQLSLVEHLMGINPRLPKYR